MICIIMAILKYDEYVWIAKLWVSRGRKSFETLLFPFLNFIGFVLFFLIERAICLKKNTR